MSNFYFLYSSEFLKNDPCMVEDLVSVETLKSLLSLCGKGVVNPVVEILDMVEETVKQEKANCWVMLSRFLTQLFVLIKTAVSILHEYLFIGFDTYRKFENIKQNRYLYLTIFPTAKCIFFTLKLYLESILYIFHLKIFTSTFHSSFSISVFFYFKFVLTRFF